MENVWFAPLYSLYFPGLRIEFHQLLSRHGHLVWIIVVCATILVLFDILHVFKTRRYTYPSNNFVLILVNVMHSLHTLSSFYTTKFLSTACKHRMVREMCI